MTPDSPLFHLALAGLLVADVLVLLLTLWRAS